MSMDIVSRLRCVLKGDKTAQAGADEIERLRAELAASREREARMRAVLETWTRAAEGDGNPVMTIIDFDKLVRVALAEGAQG